MRVLIFAYLISNCVCLDLDHNCTYQNYFIQQIGVGYPRPGDIPLLNRKVIGGRHVSILEHPYVVSIRRQTSHYLTGTLVKGNLVVTVAHPLVDVPITELAVVVGESYNDRGSVIYTVILIVFHEKFNHLTLEADLALLRIHEIIEYKPSIKIIKNIFRPDYIFDESSIGAFVTGWGRCDITPKELCLPRASVYYRDEAMNPLLRTVHMYITENTKKCDIYESYSMPVKSPKRENMLCVGPARQDDHSCACMAVPGAPLVANGRLLGLQSWGFGCGYHTDMPLVYTDMRAYRSWMMHNWKKFNDLTQNHFDQLYQVTKIAIITQWFAATRPGEENLRPTGEIQLWDIDKALAHIQGKLFDIRDFYGDQWYQMVKLERYQMIRDVKLTMVEAWKDVLQLNSHKSNESQSDDDTQSSSEDDDVGYDNSLDVNVSRIAPNNEMIGEHTE